MKQEKEQISAVGSALTMMIEMVIIRMLQPMKEQINRIKNDMMYLTDKLVKDIRVDLADTKDKVADIFTTMQHQLTDMISNIEVEAQTELMMRVNELSSKLLNIGDELQRLHRYNKDIQEVITDLEVDVKTNTEDCANGDSRIESNEIIIQELVSKLGLIGDIINE